MSAYVVAALVADSLLRHFSLILIAAAALVALALSPVASFRARSRRMQQLIVVIYAVLSVWAATNMSPHGYC